jgi:hypothetical protein
MSVGDVDQVIELYRDVSTYNSEFNHDASDQMQVLGQAELPPPASCFVCGSGNSEAGYLNFGIWAEFIGNLLICASCLTQAAEKIGCLAPSVKVLLEKNLRSLQSHSKNLETELTDVLERNRAYSVLLGTNHSAPDPHGLPDVVSEQDASDSGNATEESDNGGSSDDSEPDQSGSVSGSLHVSESSADDLTATGTKQYSDEPIRI